MDQVVIRTDLVCVQKLRGNFPSEAVGSEGAEADGEESRSSTDDGEEAFHGVGL